MNNKIIVSIVCSDPFLLFMNNNIVLNIIMSCNLFLNKHTQMVSASPIYTGPANFVVGSLGWNPSLIIWIWNWIHVCFQSEDPDTRQLHSYIKSLIVVFYLALVIYLIMHHPIIPCGYKTRIWSYFILLY